MAAGPVNPSRATDGVRAYETDTTEHRQDPSRPEEQFRPHLKQLNPKVCHIITGLQVGGAEIMLREIVKRQHAAGLKIAVISLTDLGHIGKSIAEIGIPVHALGMRRSWPNPLRLLRLAIWLRRLRPDIVHTWMYHADLIGGLIGKIASRAAILWHIHHSNLVPRQNKATTIAIARLCALLSRIVPSRIICCSQASSRAHAEIGYDSDRMIFLPNGVDVLRYRPDPDAAMKMFGELDLTPGTPLVGLIGRFHPQKDHKTFIAAAAILAKRLPEVRFLLCGNDIDWGNAELSQWIDRAGLRERFLLLGRRDDVGRVLQTLTVATLPSAFGEAFSLTLLEAMATGIPCVVTDIGDSAFIVADTGIVVATGNATALADGWAQILEMPDDKRRCLGSKARNRVVENFDLNVIGTRFEALYEEFVSSANLANTAESASRE